jgi:hypothetical protein
LRGNAVFIPYFPPPRKKAANCGGRPNSLISPKLIIFLLSPKLIANAPNCKKKLRVVGIILHLLP